MKTGEDEYRYRRVRRIRQQLVDRLGARYARTIDHEMPLIEELFLQGRSFDEICKAVQARLPGHQASRSSDFSRSPFHGAYNPIQLELTPVRQPAQRDTRRSVSPASNIFKSGPYDHYDEQRRRFEEESQLLVRKFEQSRESNFPLTHSIDYYAKLDEVKALEAYMLEKGEIDANQSGRQEMLEHLVNRYL